MQGSFANAFRQAEARLRSLQRTANTVATGIKRIWGTLSIATAGFGLFAVGNVFRKLFEDAYKSAADTQEKMLSLTNEFELHMQKQGRAHAAEQARLLMDYQKQLGKTGIIGTEIFQELADGLAKIGESPREIAAIEPALAGVLARSKGVNATMEDAHELIQAIATAATSGRVLGLRKFQIYPTPDDVTVLKSYGENWRGALNWLAENLRQYERFNEADMTKPITQIKRMQNMFHDLATEMGEKVLPAEADMAKAWEDALPAIKPYLMAGMEALGKAMSWVALQTTNFITEMERTNNIKPALDDLLKVLQDIGQQIFGFNTDGPQSFGAWIETLVSDNVRDAVRILQTLRDTIKDLKEMAGSIMPTANQAVSDVDKPWNLLRPSRWRGSMENARAIGDIAQKWTDLKQPLPPIEATRTSIPKYLKAPDEWETGAAHMHAYQTGGIAKTPQIATLAEHGPEAVIPLHKLAETATSQRENTLATRQSTKVMSYLAEQMTKLVSSMEQMVTGATGWGVGGGRFGGGMFGGAGAGSSWGPAVEAGKAAIRAGAGAPGGPAGAPTGALVGALADVRKQYAEEAANPAVQRAMFQRMSQEVGTGTSARSAAAQQAFQEELFNRAAARKQSLWQAINDPSYYPEPVFNKSVSAATAERFKGLLGIVQAGSNISNFSTGNASLGVGFGWGSTHGGEQVDFGERFGWEKRDMPWIQRMIQIAKAQKAAAGGSQVAANNTPPRYLRRYQQGGIALTPQLAMLAEKGPEVVLPQAHPSPLPSPPPEIKGALTIGDLLAKLPQTGGAAGAVGEKALTELPWGDFLKLGTSANLAVTAAQFLANPPEAGGAGLTAAEQVKAFESSIASTKDIGYAKRLASDPEYLKAKAALGGGGTSVHFNPEVTIHGNADSDAINRLEIKLKDISKNFVRDFRNAQMNERRTSFDSGY